MKKTKSNNEASAQSVSIPFAELDYGFQHGAARVTRICSDEKRGWVVLQIETPKSSIQVYVTKTGKIRIHDKDGEWFKLSKD